MFLGIWSISSYDPGFQSLRLPADFQLHQRKENRGRDQRIRGSNQITLVRGDKSADHVHAVCHCSMGCQSNVNMCKSNFLLWTKI